jgi:phospholipid/cholesterol/gamma-HCH transport system substrate-binding protein
MRKRTTQNVRVGIFVSAALGVLAAAVFAIGQERSMFRQKTRLWTSFSDINGLVVGAPVRLAGVDVGRVQKITFSSALDQRDARVQLMVEDRFMERVRLDSRAFLDSKGLLGDKIINLSVGTKGAAQLQDGAFVRPKTGPSFESLARQVENTASAIGDAAQKTGGAVSELASPEVAENLRRITGSLATILDGVAHRDGLAHRLIYDPSYAQETSKILSNLAAASANVRAASGRVDAILARVEHGPGSLNAVVYGADGAQALSELRRAAAGIAELTDQVNHGRGLAQALLRDEAGGELVKNLGEFTARLERISREVEKGRGTIGGLLVDPSVYEDMKTVLGNIERNVVFKALVRMTIKQDGLRRPAKQVQPGSGL